MDRVTELACRLGWLAATMTIPTIITTAGAWSAEVVGPEEVGEEEG